MKFPLQRLKTKWIRIINLEASDRYHPGPIPISEIPGEAVGSYPGKAFGPKSV